MIFPEKIILEFGIIPGETVVDFGSGSGRFALALSQILGSEGRGIAVDLKEEVLVMLKNMALEDGKTNIETILGDVEEKEGSGLRESIADGVLMSNILSLIGDKSAAIAEAHRILKPGRKVYVVESKLDKQEVKNVFNANSFEFERIFDIDESHYGATFKKV